MILLAKQTLLIWIHYKHVSPEKRKQENVCQQKLILRTSEQHSSKKKLLRSQFAQLLKESWLHLIWLG
jgi:hypothetical protein